MYIGIYYLMAFNTYSLLYSINRVEPQSYCNVGNIYYYIYVFLKYVIMFNSY